MHRRAVFLLVAAAVISVGANCNRPPPVKLFIDSPANGTFSTAPSILVTGHVTTINPANALLSVNGTPVVVQPDRTWSATVPLDPLAIIHPVDVQLLIGINRFLRKRITVISGDSIADGDFSPMGVAMRLNDSGLDQIEPVMESLVDLDLATLLPVGTVIADECFIDGGFLGCLGSAVVTIANPPPEIAGFSIDVDATTNSADGNIVANDMEVHVQINGSGLVPTCGLRLNAAATNILANYGLQADPVDPSLIDVNQNGAPNVNFNSFQQTYTSGICDVLIIGDIVQLIIGDVEPTVVSGLQSFLADPDGAGPQDSPIAEAIETALAEVQISGPIGQAIGVDLETPLFDVFEDVDGITLDSDARITASMPDPGAVDLLASYHVPEPFPSFGPTTPVSGTPYDLGLCISTSAFNQLLKAEVESGLLIATITELDFGGGLVPLTAGILSIIPEFAELDPATPLRIDMAPTLAPIVTGEDGPFGEISELRIAHLLASVVADDTNLTLLQFAVDATMGLDIDFVAGELSFGLGGLTSENIQLSVLVNTLDADEAGLINLLLLLLPSVLPSLADSLGTFPLPDFLGLELGLVEVSKNGEFMSLFLNLTPTP